MCTIFIDGARTLTDKGLDQTSTTKENWETLQSNLCITRYCCTTYARYKCIRGICYVNQIYLLITIIFLELFSSNVNVGVLLANTPPPRTAWQTGYTFTQRICCSKQNTDTMMKNPPALAWTGSDVEIFLTAMEVAPREPRQTWGLQAKNRLNSSLFVVRCTSLLFNFYM